MPAARLRAARALVPLLVLGLALAGCAGGPPVSRSAPGEVTVALSTPPSGLDYTRNSGVAIPQALLYNVYETLVKIAPDGRLQPLLAESWTVSPDRLEYTFALRRGVTFTDGTPFTADDVVFSFDRLDTWTTASAAQLSRIAETRAPSPHVVRLRLSEPDNALLASLAGPAGTIFTPSGAGTLATDPVGTGPYDVASYDTGATMRLVANDRWWGGRPPMRSITLAYYTDPTAQTNALLTGGADAALGVGSPQLLPRFADDSAFRVTEGTTNGEMVLAMNNAAPPFDDVRLRRAVRHAVDDDAVREIAMEGRGRPITSMVPPTDPWFDDRPDPYPHDPARARELLAGQRPEISFKVPNLPQYVRAAQAVQSDLQAAGFVVDLQLLEFPAVWLGEVFTGHDYQLSLVIHAEPRDIGTFSSPTSYFGFDDPRAAAVLAAARSGPPEQYVDRMREYARIVTDEAAAGFLYLTPWINVVHADVTGEPTGNASESIDLTAIRRAGP